MIRCRFRTKPPLLSCESCTQSCTQFLAAGTQMNPKCCRFGILIRTTDRIDRISPFPKIVALDRLISLESPQKMVELLVKLVGILRESVEQTVKLVQSTRKKAVLLDLLTAYFILADIAEAGDELVALGGTDPVHQVSTLPAEKAKQWIGQCRASLWRQRNNLGRLGELLMYKGVPILDILEPGLLRDLKKTIGSKEKGLFSIGAVLEMYFIWGAIPEEEDIRVYGETVALYRCGASILQLMLTSTEGTLRIEDAIRELETLKRDSELLRTQIVKLCSSDELVELTGRARARATSDRRLYSMEELGPIIDLEKE